MVLGSKNQKLTEAQRTLDSVQTDDDTGRGEGHLLGDLCPGLFPPVTFSCLGFMCSKCVDTEPDIGVHARHTQCHKYTLKSGLLSRVYHHPLTKISVLCCRFKIFVQLPSIRASTRYSNQWIRTDFSQNGANCAGS